MECSHLCGVSITLNQTCHNVKRKPVFVGDFLFSDHKWSTDGQTLSHMCVSLYTEASHHASVCTKNHIVLVVIYYYIITFRDDD